MPDIVFGSLATLAAAICTSRIRIPPLALAPVVLFNAIIVGATISFTMTPGVFWEGFALNAMQIGLGELGVMYIFGLPLLHALPKNKYFKELINKFSDGGNQ